MKFLEIYKKNLETLNMLKIMNALLFFLQKKGYYSLSNLV